MNFFCIKNKNNNVIGYGNLDKFVTEQYLQQQIGFDDKNYEIIELVEHQVTQIKSKTAIEIVAIIKDTLKHQQMLVHNRLEKDKTPIRIGYQASLINLIKDLMERDELLKTELAELLKNDSHF